MAACKSLDELSRVMKEDVVPRCLDFIMDILEDDFFTPDERAAVESLLKRPCVADSVKERRVSPSASTTSIRTADVDAEEPTARDDFHVPSDLYTLRFSRSSDHDGYFSECLIQDSQKLEEIIQVLANHGYIDAGDQRLLLYRLTGRCKPKDEDSSRKITWKGKENDLYYVLSLIKPEKKHHKEKMKEFFECGFSGIDSYSSRRRNASSTLKEDLNKIDPGIFRLYLETRLPPVATEERCRERQ